MKVTRVSSSGTVKGMLAPSSAPLCAVTFVPALVDGDFGFVVASGDADGLEDVDAVAVGVLQPTSQTVGRPIAGAADFVLEIAGHVGDEAVDAVGDPAGLVVEKEGDGGVLGQRQGNVGAAGFGVQAKIDIPGVVEGRFVFIIASGNGESGLPQLVFFVIDEVGDGAVGLPIASTAEDALDCAGDGDGFGHFGGGRG